MTKADVEQRHELALAAWRRAIELAEQHKESSAMPEVVDGYWRDAERLAGIARSCSGASCRACARKGAGAPMTLRTWP